MKKGSHDYKSIPDKIKTFSEEVAALTDGKYNVNSYDVNSHKFIVTHCKCGHIYAVTRYQFIKMNRRCPKCNGGVRYAYDDVKNKISAETHGEYSLINYNSEKHKYLVQHNSTVCGNFQFYTTYGRFFGKKKNKQRKQMP